MNTATILDLIKARVGISSNIRDTYLLAIIESVIKELEDEKGINLQPDNMNHVMFIVDYSTWRYQNRDSEKGLPENLYWRLRNLYIGGAVNDI